MTGRQSHADRPHEADRATQDCWKAFKRIENRQQTRIFLPPTYLHSYLWPILTVTGRHSHADRLHEADRARQDCRKALRWIGNRPKPVNGCQTHSLSLLVSLVVFLSIRPPVCLLLACNCLTFCKKFRWSIHFVFFFFPLFVLTSKCQLGPTPTRGKAQNWLFQDVCLSVRLGVRPPARLSWCLNWRGSLYGTCDFISCYHVLLVWTVFVSTNLLMVLIFLTHRKSNFGPLSGPQIKL